ncbi:MAG TPA: hypothetical protein DCL77_20410 [Prolixibacteraceae bacterium]|jgi:hypothetical protein|nr:hypothetical protein [Prolixibacteraceae bacterium]
MTGFVFITIVFIIVGFFSGLLYLGYLPFRNRLLKSGKLTDKLNRQINWTFILLLCLTGVVLFCLKDFRTSSKDRLEKIADLKLPTNFKVLKDEYQDMWQDYCIIYYIQLDKNSTTEFIKNIKASRFYHMKIDSGKTEWSKSLKGYNFNRQEGHTMYSIELDTVVNILKYNEGAD